MKISSRHILKEAGPKERSRATGLNWDFASSTLGEGQHSKEEIQKYISENSGLLPISTEQLDSIERLNLKDNAAKRVSADEKFFIIVSAVIDSSSESEAIAKIEEVEWYLEYKELSPNKIKGDWLSSNQAVLSNKDLLLGTWRKFLNEARVVKSESEKQSLDSGSAEYLSNEVVHDFGDGWKVVYVPAAGEIKEFPGMSNTSYDRILEGNKNGLCLGASMGLYQDNNSGKIYSVRDPSNKPKVTIRINGNDLEEAKGKNNLSPEIIAAKKAKEWFEILESKGELNFRDNGDYLGFPPLTIESAKTSFEKNKERFIESGWAVHWYKNGLSNLDSKIQELIEKKDPLILSSGLNKKYAELVLPIYVFYSKEYLDKKLSPLFPNIDYIDWGYNKIAESEFWKTYRKNPTIFSAVSLFASENYILFLKLGIPKDESYKSLLNKNLFIKLIKENKININDAFQLMEQYPELKDISIVNEIYSKPEKIYEFDGENNDRWDLLAEDSEDAVTNLIKLCGQIDQDIFNKNISHLLKIHTNGFIRVLNRNNLFKNPCFKHASFIKELFNSIKTKYSDLNNQYEVSSILKLKAIMISSGMTDLIEELMGRQFLKEEILDDKNVAKEEWNQEVENELYSYVDGKKLLELNKKYFDIIDLKRTTYRIAMNDPTFYFDLLDDGSKFIDSSPETTNLILEDLCKIHPHVITELSTERPRYINKRIFELAVKNIFEKQVSANNTYELKGTLEYFIDKFEDYKDYFIWRAKQEVLKTLKIYENRSHYHYSHYHYLSLLQSGLLNYFPELYEGVIIFLIKNYPIDFFYRIINTLDFFNNLSKYNISKKTIHSSLLRLAIDDPNFFATICRDKKIDDQTIQIISQSLVRNYPKIYEKIYPTAGLPKDPMILNKISELILLLNNLGLKKEASNISQLLSPNTPGWLKEWRDTMRHYGFQNFGRDQKWHKGKSFLEEPMDIISAEQDIHMVEQAHSPDEKGRRISNKRLNTFMREFYGENIWIAPREGWKGKMKNEE